MPRVGSLLVKLKGSQKLQKGDLFKDNYEKERSSVIYIILKHTDVQMFAPK
jgi:hypothetical protein